MFTDGVSYNLDDTAFKQCINTNLDQNLEFDGQQAAYCISGLAYKMSKSGEKLKLLASVGNISGQGFIFPKMGIEDDISVICAQIRSNETS